MNKRVVPKPIVVKHIVDLNDRSLIDKPLRDSLGRFKSKRVVGFTTIIMISLYVLLLAYVCYLINYA